MFKFKNFKILLLLILFAFAGNNAWAGDYSWFHFTANVKAQVKTAEGLVYDVPEAGNVYAKWESNSAEEANQTKSHTHPSQATNVSSFEQDVTLHAIPNTGFRFLYWTKEDGSIISASEAEQNDGKATITCKATRRCYYGGSKSGQTDNEEYPKHMESHDNLTEQYGTYSNIFNYYAVFEPISASIAVKSNNTSIGRAICSKYDNKKDDQVTIKAYCIDYDTKFLGWEVNGEIISRENPYTFTVTNEASDDPIIYTAIFENGYNFHRIRNYVTKNYLNAVSDEGNAATLVSGGAITSLELNTNDLNDVMYEAGSIVDIYYARIPNDNRYYYDYFVQGAKASKYYDFDPDDPTSSTAGVFLRMPFDAKTYTNTWAFATANEGGFRFTDDNGTPKITMGERPESQWYIECIDKDLNTKENYFSLDPNKLIEVDGKYYTTLRTSWNILYNPEQMTPYVVTSVDEETGTFEMEPITGNIIPLGTPVIIETKSTSIEENRMVPTTTAFTGTKPATNLLQTSTKYFPNQSVSGNYKALMVNGEGQLAFGGTALTTVNGNEAYLQVANDVALKPIADLPTLATLKDIESTGEKGKLYTVEDGLVAVAFAVDEQENCALLWCKDQAESNAKTEVKTGQTDYMKNQYAKLYKSPAPEKWDQSNWVAVKLVPYKNVGLRDIATRLKDDVVGHVLKPKAVTGTYSDDVNYTIAMAMPEQDGKVIFENMIGDAFTYNENLYCTANFLSENLVGENGVTQSTTAEHYYFVNPKIQEVAKVTFAVWNGSYFVAPAPQEGTSTNESEINGAFNVDWRYNSYIINTLASNKAYQFMAVVQKPVAVAGGMGLKEESEVTPMDCTPDGTYMVFPLNLDPSNKDQVITSIAQLVVSKTVSRVVYYNLMGVASAVPFQGVNIVVSEYSDGSRKARKVVMK